MTLLRPALLAAALLLGAPALTAVPAAAQDVKTVDSSTAPAGVYTLDPAHSSVTMRVSHFGLSYATLRFNRMQATLNYDPVHPERAKLDVTIDPASIDSGNEALNRQIAEELFDAGKFPQIHFVSTAIKPTIESRGQVTGDLTFHGVTHPVDLDVLFNGAGQDAQHETRLGFSANTTIARSQYGITKYRPAAGDEVSIDIEVEFKK